MNQSTSKGSIALDQSNHTLNNSSSKQKFSFPKASRFDASKSGCDSFYQIPSTRARRGTSFGYGHKDIGIRSNRYNAQPCSYEMGSQFIKSKKGTSFGPGRQEMALGGPMKESLLQKYIPGPGKYQQHSTLDNSHITLKPRIKDKSQDHLLKNPGPGTYECEQIGRDKYYITSKHPNKTNFAKISPPHSNVHQNRTINVGPGSYENNREDLNKDGKYVLSKNKSSKTRQFTKSPRQSIVYKHLLSTPGPTNYSPFTYFGQV